MRPPRTCRRPFPGPQRLLPPDMPTPPHYRKVNPADQPILILALSSRILPLSTVDEYAETLMAQRISMISGVAQVQVYGPQKYAVRVQLNPNALTTMGIGIDEVEKAIAAANVNLPTGTLYGRHQALTVKATGQLTEAAAYRPLIVAYRNGSPVYLEQLGRVIDSVENDKVASWYNDEPGHDPGHSAPARDQHRRGGGFDQKAPAHLPGADALDD